MTATATARRIKAKSSVPAARSRQASASTLPKPRPTRAASRSDDEEFLADSDADDADVRKPKRRKTVASQKDAVLKLHEKLFGRETSSIEPPGPCSLPDRTHSILYHKPLLLSATIGRKGQDSLLAWFDSVDSARSMPWRKSWVDPASVDSPEELRTVLERRAYEVWISEIMLQQTRVAVVIDYWNRWMARWPTIHDLAAASADDVLAAWKGLGYYSRATRIHEAAKHVVSHPKMKGLLPEDVKTLEAEVPGVGRYTAGAISAIVFGNADPLVDGNVLRVLSRQLGILGNVKTDKATIDTLWAAADALVKDVAAGADGIESIGAPPKSNRPGRWGQALMELGSTVCTPKPNCSSCPISSTCRVYNEGQALATKSAKKNAVVDIEDACTLCSPFENAETEGADEEPQKENKKPESAKQTTLSAFFTRPTNGRAAAAPKPNAKEVAARDEAIAEYARKFPLKVVKKPVREEETLVCAVRRGDGRYLLHRRPDKGLLAGLWEFPSRILEEGEGKTMSQRTQLVKSHVAGLDGVGGLGGKIKHLGELGSVPWLFSHLKLVMHVHLLTIEGGDDAEDQVENLKDAERSPSRWSGDVDQESMGTGMNKCWLMVKETEGSVAS